MASHCRPASAAIAVAFTVLGSCGGGGEHSSSGAAPAPDLRYGISAPDLQIAAQLYAGTQRTPIGFHSDTPPDGSGVVATYHVQNVHLAPAADRHELCTDVWSEALQWSNAAGGAAEPLMGNSANDRYYEFQRVRYGTPQVSVRARVYRCEYLDRSNANLETPEGSAGTLNRRPMDATALRTLSEYLWHFSAYNNADYAVIASRGASNGGLQHELVLAQLERAVSGGCDRVTVRAWRHRLDVNSGALLRELAPLWEFTVRNSPTGAQVC